jgi:hypothetical protein
VSEIELYRPEIVRVNAVEGDVIGTKQTNAVHIIGQSTVTGVRNFQTIKSNTVPGTVPTWPNWQEAPSLLAGCFQLPDLTSLLNAQ